MHLTRALCLCRLAHRVACDPWCRFQKGIAAKLKPIDVDPADKSVKAFFTRARNAALAGVNHDIHAEIADDADLTSVSCNIDQALAGSRCSKLLVPRYEAGLVLHDTKFAEQVHQQSTRLHCR